MDTTVSIIHGKRKERLEVVMAFQAENRFLSNFWECDVTLPEEVISGQEFPAMDFKTVENAYQAWKSESLEQRIVIQSMTAGESKDFSRTDEFQKRTDITDDLRIQVMDVLLQQKFGDKNPKIKEMLLNKGDALLIEGNNWQDGFFGFCLETGQGQNHLGRLIMKIRSDLKS